MALDLENSRLPWHHDRVAALLRGERVPPICVDMSLTQACDYRCVYCYAQLQKNPGSPLSQAEIQATLYGMSSIGVKAVSFVSDGESTLNPHWQEAIVLARDVGLDVGIGTSGYHFEPTREVMQSLTYVRFNFSAASPKIYDMVHRPPAGSWSKVIDTIRETVRVGNTLTHRPTVGMQMVYLAGLEEEAENLCLLARALGVDYLQIKHCSDDERGSLGVNYDDVREDLPALLRLREEWQTPTFQVIVKERKIRAGNERNYSRCRAPALHLQISGSGLVAPCGMFFSPRYEEYHIGSLHEKTFVEIWKSDRYWQVMDRLSGPLFDARTDCGCLCLQDESNRYLEEISAEGLIVAAAGPPPPHVNFP